MSIIFTRHGHTGRTDTPLPPTRQEPIAPVKPAAGVANLIAAMPKTIAEFIKAYGQKEWEKFRATILATPSTVAYLQASDAYGKAAVDNLLLKTEAEMKQRVIDKWEEQIKIQQSAIKDGIGFIAQQWQALDTATQKFLSGFTGAFVGTQAQADEQFKGGAVTWAPKKMAKSSQNAKSPAGPPIPVGEMNDPVGKIAFPDAAKFWLTANNADFAKAVGGTLTAQWPMKDSQTLDFLRWAATQTSTLFRKDVADWWFEVGMVPALANFGAAVQQRVNLINAIVNLPQAIANNKAYLKNDVAPKVAASEKVMEAAKAAAVDALKKVGHGVPAECATAQAAVNFEFAMAAALLKAQAMLNEAVKAGLTNSANILDEMQKLQAKLAEAKTAAEKEMIAAQIMALGGGAAADLSRSNSRLADRKGKMASAKERIDQAIKIAEAHGLDGYAARQAAKAVDEQIAAGQELNTAHQKTADAIAAEVVKVVDEVTPDAGKGGKDAGGEIKETLGDNGDNGDNSDKGSSGVLWLIAAAAAAKFFM